MSEQTLELNGYPSAASWWTIPAEQIAKGAPALSLQLADPAGLHWAQEQVSMHHYLHRPVDQRCSLLAYLVLYGGQRVGALIFGRPEAQRVTGWYGSIEDVAASRCRPLSLFPS